MEKILRRCQRRIGVLACLCAIFLIGCWDSSELSNRGFVTAISIDIDQDVSDAYSVTLEMPQISGDEPDKGKDIKTGVHRSLNNAIYSSNSSSERDIFLGHMKALVCGEGLLKDRELFKHAMDTLIRDRSVSRTLLVLATPGEGADIIDFESKDESLIGAYISNFFKKRNPSTLHRQTLDSLAKYFAEGQTAIIPRIEAGDEGFTFSGAAVMSDYTLRGWLDEYELRALSWLHDNAKHLEFSIEHEEYVLSIKINKYKSEFDFFELDERLYAKIKIALTGDLEEAPGTKNIDKCLLQRITEDSIRNDIERVHEALYVRMGVDGFNISRELEKKRPNLHRRHIEIGGIDILDMPFVLEIDVMISGTGSIAE